MTAVAYIPNPELSEPQDSDVDCDPSIQELVDKYTRLDSPFLHFGLGLVLIVLDVVICHVSFQHWH